jgi:hypothetical protein
MKHIILLTLGLFVALMPAAEAQENEAEKLFRAMEKKITAAKAFHVTVTLELQATNDKERESRFQGMVLFTNENKAHLKISGDAFGEVQQYEMISDGKQVYLKPYTLGTRESFKEEDKVATPKNLYRHLARTASRIGIHHLLHLAIHVMQADNPEESSTEFWDFQMVGARKISGRDAHMIRYEAGRKELKDSLHCTLWIDSTRGLPLKRVMETKFFTVTETYTTFTLDPRIDTNAFVLPK